VQQIAKRGGRAVCAVSTFVTSRVTSVAGACCSARTKSGGRNVFLERAVRPACGGRPETAKVSDPVEYKGYIIRAAPYKNNAAYQTAGVIERELDGVRKEHRFIRADAYASYDDAVTFTLNKARQIIDLQGDRMFD
jgi:hypothetical protein